MIYFDNASTTKPCGEAVEAFAECAHNNFGNPSSLHSLGIRAEQVVLSAKKAILDKFPENDAHFVFTSGATESNCLAVSGLYRACGRRMKKTVTTAIEHKSVSAAVKNLSAETSVLSPKDYPDCKAFEDAITAAVDDETALVSIIAVNNETGYIIDTERIYKTVKRKNPQCMVHTDGVQAFLKIPIFGDTISVSAHKIHGIKGIGGLYVKKKVRVLPIIHGGEQQNGFRAGTEAVELAASFEAAVRAYKYECAHYRNLTEILLQLLREKIGVDNIRLNCGQNNLKNIFNFSVKGIKSEIMIHFLAENDIYVSGGSACARGKKSEVLPHFGVSPCDVDSALRLSFSSENRVEELIRFTECLETGFKRFGKQKS